MSTKKLFGNAEILHNLPYEAISVTVDKSTTGTVDENARKILKAGTLLAGDGASIFADRSKRLKQIQKLQMVFYFMMLMLQKAMRLQALSIAGLCVKTKSMAVQCQKVLKLH